MRWRAAWPQWRSSMWRDSSQPSDRRCGAAEARAETSWVVDIGLAHRLVGAVDVAADTHHRLLADLAGRDERRQQGVGRHHRLHAAGIIGVALADRAAGD